MDRKRSRDEPSETTQAIAKVVAARGSSAVVTVVSHDVPEEMFTSLPGYYEVMYSDPYEIVFSGSGIIIECQASISASADARFSPLLVYLNVLPTSTLMKLRLMFSRRLVFYTMLNCWLGIFTITLLFSNSYPTLVFQPLTLGALMITFVLTLPTLLHFSRFSLVPSPSTLFLVLRLSLFPVVFLVLRRVFIMIPVISDQVAQRNLVAMNSMRLWTKIIKVIMVDLS